ncbi:trypsin-like serine protease [Streptomyces thermocarboxydus]
MAASDTTYAYTAKITVGAHDRGCSAVLVDPEWLLTAASCFAEDPAVSLAVPAASPPRPPPPSSAAPTSTARRAPSAASSSWCRAPTATWCWPASAGPSPT